MNQTQTTTDPERAMAAARSVVVALQPELKSEPARVDVMATKILARDALIVLTVGDVERLVEYAASVPEDRPLHCPTCDGDHA